MKTEFHHWDEVAGESDAAGIRRSVIAGVGADLKRIEIPAGTRAGRHAHPFEQFVLVEKGRLQLTTPEGTTPLAAGAVFRFAPDTWHQAVFEEDTILLEVNLRA